MRAFLWIEKSLALLLLSLALSGPASGQVSSPPTVTFRCVTSEKGALHVAVVVEEGLSTCRGEVFARGEGLWGHSTPQLPLADAGPRPMQPPEPQAGGILHLALKPEGPSTPSLPDAFVAAVLRGRGEKPFEDRVLCERATERVQDAEAAPARYVCAAPAGPLSVRIEVPPFATSFLWDLRVPVAGTVRATVQLPEAVTLVGEVADAEAVASLAPRGLGDDTSRLAFAGQSTDLHRGGAVRFRRVAPGAYVYRLEGRNGLFSRAQIVVPDGAREAMLPDLALPEVATLGVQVVPAADGYGQAWTLRLVPRAKNYHTTKPVTTTTDPTGWQSLAGVVEGDYLLFVEDSAGSLWLSEPLHVADDKTLNLELPRVAVEGRARRGEKPFVGKLIFGGLHRSRRLTFATDEDGRFSGFLPEEGRWEVEIASKDLGCAPCDGDEGSLRIPPVDVQEGPSGKALLDIEIPDTTLKGRVVVEETAPDGETIRHLAAGATIVVVRATGPLEDRGRQAQIWTDDGTFELVGLEPGDAHVGAMLGDPPYESDWVGVHLEEGGHSAQPVELVLRPKTGLVVQISSAAGAVGGATVTAIVPDGKSAQGLSGPDGRARLELAAGKRGTLVVEAPGYGLALVPFRVPPGGSGSQDPLLVSIAPAGGSLVLSHLPYDVLREGTLISEAGGALALRLLPTLVPGAISFGESITISGLASGQYRLCTDRGDCWRGTVFAGGSSELSLSEMK